LGRVKEEVEGRRAGVVEEVAGAGVAERVARVPFFRASNLLSAPLLMLSSPLSRDFGRGRGGMTTSTLPTPPPPPLGRVAPKVMLDWASLDAPPQSSCVGGGSLRGETKGAVRGGGRTVEVSRKEKLLLLLLLRLLLLEAPPPTTPRAELREEGVTFPR
jgi:hypothetical protein